MVVVSRTHTHTGQKLWQCVPVWPFILLPHCKGGYGVLLLAQATQAAIHGHNPWARTHISGSSWRETSCFMPSVCECECASVPVCVCLLYGGCYWLVFDFIDFHKAAFTTNFASILDTRFNSTRFDSYSTLFASQLEEAAAAAAVKTLGHLHWPSTTFCVAMDQFRTHRTHGLNCKLDMKPER